MQRIPIQNMNNWKRFTDVPRVLLNLQTMYGILILVVSLIIWCLYLLRDLGPDFLVLFSSGSHSLNLKPSLFVVKTSLFAWTLSHFEQKSCHLKTFFSRKDDDLREREKKEPENPQPGLLSSHFFWGRMPRILWEFKLLWGFYFLTTPIQKSQKKR